MYNEFLVVYTLFGIAMGRLSGNATTTGMNVLSSLLRITIDLFLALEDCPGAAWDIVSGIL